MNTVPEVSDIFQALELNDDDIVPAPDKVKIEAVEPLPEGCSHVRRHRVRKWFRTTFKWCVGALSLRCLRRQEHTRTRAIRRSVAQVQVPEEADDIRLITEEDDASVHDQIPRIETGTLPHPHNVADSWDNKLLGPLSPAQLDTSPAHAPRIYGASKGDLLTNLLYGYMNNVDVQSTQGSSVRMCAAQNAAIPSAPTPDTQMKLGPWSSDEHERYCSGLEMYRYGSWKLIAEHVGTRTERQVLSHTQSIRAKRKRADEREKRDQAGRASSLASKSARTTSATSAVSSTPGALIYSTMRNRTSEELLIASMKNPFSTSSSSSSTKETSSKITAQCDAVATNSAILSPTIAGVFSFQLTSEENLMVEQQNATEWVHKDNLELLLTTEDYTERYGDACLDFDVCFPSVDILVENVFSDDELLELLDSASTLAKAPTAV